MFHFQKLVLVIELKTLPQKHKKITYKLVIVDYFKSSTKGDISIYHFKANLVSELKNSIS